VLRDTLRFMGWPIDETLIAESVRAASFKNMRDLENRSVINHHSLRTSSLDPRARKIREGKIGSFRNQLNEQDIAYIERCIERIGDPFADYYTP
jgi:hypothetical protein